MRDVVRDFREPGFEELGESTEAIVSPGRGLTRGHIAPHVERGYLNWKGRTGEIQQSSKVTAWK